MKGQTRGYCDAVKGSLVGGKDEQSHIHVLESENTKLKALFQQAIDLWWKAEEYTIHKPRCKAHQPETWTSRMPCCDCGLFDLYDEAQQLENK